MDNQGNSNDREGPIDVGTRRRLTVVLVREREAGWRDLRAVLDHDRTIRVLGDLADSAEARAAIKGVRPDVVLIDAQLAGHDLAQFAANLRAESADSRIVVIGGREYLDQDTLLALKQLRTPGYLVWEQVEATDVPAIMEALRSENVVIGTWAVLDAVLAGERRRQPRAEGIVLSEEERAVLMGERGKEEVRVVHATLWEESEDVTAVLGVVFEQAGIGLNVVRSAEALLNAAHRAGPGDFVILDCSRALPDDTARCVRVVTQTATPVHVIHPGGIEESLRLHALGRVVGVRPASVGLPLLDQLRLVKQRRVRKPLATSMLRFVTRNAKSCDSSPMGRAICRSAKCWGWASARSDASWRA